MKILLVIDQFFSANNGMTISARRLCAKLVEHGNDVRIVSTGKEGDTEYLVKKQYIPIFDKLVTAQGMTFAKADDEILEKAISWAQIVHLLVPFGLSRHAIELCQDNNVPYTAAFHCQAENVTSSLHLNNFRIANDFVYWWFKRYIYQYCPFIHCPSIFIANELVKHGYESKIYVISNGIDADFCYNKQPKVKELQGKYIILNIGRLSVEKRQDVLIKAVSISKYKKDIQVMLAGQGPRKKNILELAQKLDVPVNISFYSKQELIELISMTDLYVHPSEAEIEAISCMEAFASGLVPVIADSKKSATVQFALDNRSLFETGNSEQLANKIDYWIEHEDEKKKMEIIYSNTAKKYDLDECIYKIEEMFKDAIEKHKLKEEEKYEYKYAK
jgi:glycosyltransferase involved in cell wall biosynthesis